MHDDRPEGHDTVISKGECPKCGSKDNNVLYADGHEHCFSPGCDHWKAADGQDLVERLTQPHADRKFDLLDPSGHPGAFDALNKRGLKSETLRKFGVFAHGYSGKMAQVYPYHNMEGELCAQKLRLPDKSFPLLKAPNYPGALSECQLFGRHVFGDRYDRQVVVCEGELDALSVAQATEFKLAVVSVNTGAQSAEKVLKANYLWLDRFKEIILWLDSDEPGKLATEECAKLFKVGKVRLATASGFMPDGKTRCKDASDILQANRPGDIMSCIYAATTWRPKGIVNAADNPEDVMAPKEGDHAFIYEWPWTELNETLGPILPGQVCYHVAGTGIGKTTAVVTITLNLLKQGAKIGYLSFEGSRREIKLSLLTIHAGKRLDIEPLPDDEMAKLHDNLFGSRQIEMFDPETAEWSMEAINGYIRYLVKALDCQVAVVDPFSFVVAGLSQVEDERRALDMASRNFAATAKELGCHLQISHHLTRPQGLAHEEGAQTSLNQVRGSGGIANFATFVIGHERNQQADGSDYLLTQLRSLKNRPRSKTGPMLVLEYDLKTGRLTPTTKPFPKPGKGDGGERRSGFAPASESDDY